MAAHIPVHCPKCDLIFSSKRTEAERGDILELVRQRERCIRCGFNAEVIEGLFVVGEHRLKVIEASDEAKRILERIEPAIKKKIEADAKLDR